MPNTLTFAVPTKEGKLDLCPAERQRMADWIQLYNKYSPEGYVKLQLTTIKSPKRIKRTNPQNAYYWAAVIPTLCDAIQEATGEAITSEDAHELAKAKCLTKEVIMQSTGEVLSITGSTTQLSPAEFGDYVERVMAWANNFFEISFPQQVPID